MRAALAIALLACAVLGAATFAEDQRLQHANACLATLHDSVNPRVDATVRSRLVDLYDERGCP